MEFLVSFSFFFPGVMGGKRGGTGGMVREGGAQLKGRGPGGVQGGGFLLWEVLLGEGYWGGIFRY